MIIYIYIYYQGASWVIQSQVHSLHVSPHASHVPDLSPNIHVHYLCFAKNKCVDLQGAVMRFSSARHLKKKVENRYRPGRTLGVLLSSLVVFYNTSIWEFGIRPKSECCQLVPQFMLVHTST